jgi:protein gp37
MSEKSNIAWTDATWNPWRGCTKVSPGCDNCYAEKLVTTRLGGEWGKGKPRVRAAEATFNAPLAWNKKPFIHSCGHASAFVNDPCPKCNMVGEWHTRRVFLGSLMDWLDPEVPIEWLADALDIVRRCDNLEWITVTKRPELWRERMGLVRNSAIFGDLAYWISEWMSGYPPDNITVLTSVENQAMLEQRIVDLLKIPCLRRGLSCEPLLEPLDLGLNGIVPKDISPRFRPVGEMLHWVVVGGESGPNARPCNLAWIRSVVEQCKSAGVPVFVKQTGSRCIEWNGANVRHHYNHPKGGDPAEWAEDLRVQQYPF